MSKVVLVAVAMFSKTELIRKLHNEKFIICKNFIKWDGTSFFLSSIEGEQKEIGIKTPILHLRIDLNKKSLLQTSQFESKLKGL
jgi:hypothetical protein